MRISSGTIRFSQPMTERGSSDGRWFAVATCCGTVPNAADHTTALSIAQGEGVLFRGDERFLLAVERAGRTQTYSNDISIAAGVVRLDNRDDLTARLSRIGIFVDANTTDLAVATLFLLSTDATHVRELLGDFAFVIYDVRRETLTAARDSFGVECLFYEDDGPSIRLASRAELLGGRGYDHRYLARFVVGQPVSDESTVYAGVKRLQHAHHLEWGGRGVRDVRYWDPSTVPVTTQDPFAASKQFREIFADAVRTRLRSARSVWADLSGGLDTSSVVLMAHHLTERGFCQPLAGTRTYVDEIGEAREYQFVEEVLRATGLPNTTVKNDWPWRSDDEAPPLTDEPSPLYPYFANERAFNSVVTRAGGDVVLTGQGADYYLHGGLHHITDLVAGGRLVESLRAINGAAQVGRRSFWNVGWRFGIVPFLPPILQYRSLDRRHQLPPWITPSAARCASLSDVVVGGHQDFEVGTSYTRRETVRQLSGLPCLFSGSLPSPGLEFRHPFLYRPLVEAALGYEANLMSSPGVTKAVLREAMRGLLPEAVRLRRTKAMADGRFAWALRRERSTIEELLRDPILAELGVVSVRQLVLAVDNARCGALTQTAYLLSTLALETWLSVRAGKWKRMPREFSSTESSRPTLEAPMADQVAMP